MADEPNVLQFKGKTHIDDSRCTTGCTNSNELDDLRATWPALPLPIRELILSVITANTDTKANRKAA